MIEFIACKNLTYDKTAYGKACKLNLISSSNTIKAVWVRDKGRGNLVQFCNQRGRINSAEGCLNKKSRWCPDYEETTHSIEESNIDE